MARLKKLLICPYFGPLPDWYPYWYENAVDLGRYGYDLLIDHDLEAFEQRVADYLDVDCPIVPGEGKIHDYRCAFGMLYADELRRYDYWGHTDFDCVYGRVPFFIPDEALAELEQFSNHPTYVSGPWSLYRNSDRVNTLFQQAPDWRDILSMSSTTGWVEKGYSELVAAELEHLWVNFQTRDLNDFSTVHFDGDRLLEGDREIMVAHFRRTKVYPEGCR